MVSAKIDVEKALEKPDDPKRVEQQRDVFRRTLERYVPEAGYSPQRARRILNLGCGRSYESMPLGRYFGGAVVVGIDKDEVQIERARALYSGFHRYVFVVVDGTELSRSLGEFEVAVSRHHTTIASSGEWNKIFSETKKVLKPDGILIATSFQDIEHIAARRQLEDAGYTVVVDCKNEFAIPITKHVAVDRNVLIARPHRNLSP